jgi:hypothetical protein
LPADDLKKRLVLSITSFNINKAIKPLPKHCSPITTEGKNNTSTF